MHGLSRAFPGDLPAVAAELIVRLRERGPRVHCITNTVAQAFTANVLLAAGAIPSMTIAPQEVADFAARADALLINLGTFDSERRVAIDIALEQVAQRGRPWVLDPVLIDVSQPRAAYAGTLSDRRPTAIRLNAAEFSTLAGASADAGSVSALSVAKQCVIGLTGAADIVSDGTRKVEIANGHPLMNSVTAMGCAASALVAACLCLEKDPFVATASALLAFSVVGETAAETAKGPGSFAVHFIDAIHNLDRATLIQRAKVT